MKSDFTLHSNCLKSLSAPQGPSPLHREGGHSPSFFTHPGCYPTVWRSPVRFLGQAGANIRLHCCDSLALLRTPLLPQGEDTEKTGHSLPLSSSFLLPFLLHSLSPPLYYPQKAKGETVSWSQMALPTPFWVLPKAAGSQAVGPPGTTKAARVGIEVEHTA